MKRLLTIVAPVLLATATAASATTYGGHYRDWSHSYSWDWGKKDYSWDWGNDYDWSRSYSWDWGNKFRDTHMWGNGGYDWCACLGDDCDDNPDTPSEVPLPASSLLLLGGLGVFAGLRRKKKS